MPGPLDGVTVLDMTTVGFGPYACQILGDYGADVIKVESHDGDITRGIVPYENAGMGHFFLNANRNKRSIVLDLKRDDARDVMLKLAAGADVLISSVRPAAMARLGLSHADLQAVNPEIVYVALVGFGQDGPYAKRPAYDDIIQGMTGMADMQGGRSGTPTFVNASICDKIGSQFAVHATLAALFSRERTGKGQYVEVPMLESIVGFNLVEHNSGRTFEPPKGPAGYERSMVEYRRPYATRDGFVCVLPYNEKQWKSFFALMQRDEMLQDPRVTDAAQRSACIGELYALVAECVADWDTVALLDALEGADVPSGPATRLDDLEKDPHLEAIGLFEHFDHPSEGQIRLPRPGVKFSETALETRHLPARLGEHSVEILRENGFQASEIAGLLESGVTLDGAASPEQTEAAE